ncbi:ABC transporter ATP-binding protein [Streptomyces sp. cg35]|uniref:ABC transporter ATP-binding protein n=1 Tax=Streptomyces sp. cg35 TaxID=3421650 RepID=UPI003D178760
MGHAPGEELIQAAALRKTYRSGGDGAFTAVDGIDFSVRRGEAFGLLGSNGAGKSSTMRMIACVSQPSGGDLRILGLDAATRGPEIRARLGVVPQDDTVDTELTVLENLLIYGRYFGLPRRTVRERAGHLLEFARLSDKARAPVQSLSGGMRRRLTIARALVNDPDIVLLDEPTTGLDPQARHLLWERLFRLRQDGVTLVVTTHYMDEAEQLCDRLVVMDAGRIVAMGSPRELIDRHCAREVLELRFTQADRETMVAKARDLFARVEVLPDRVLVSADDGEEALAIVGARALDPVTTLVRRSTLEDVFLALTGRALTD